MKRYEKTLADFEAMQKELQDTPTMDEMKEIDRRMAESIDYLFNAPVSEKFFSITSPFTVLDGGQFFVENVINAIRGVIEPKRNVKLEAVQRLSLIHI